MYDIRCRCSLWCDVQSQLIPRGQWVWEWIFNIPLPPLSSLLFIVLSYKRQETETVTIQTVFYISASPGEPVRVFIWVAWLSFLYRWRPDSWELNSWTLNSAWYYRTVWFLWNLTPDVYNTLTSMYILQSHSTHASVLFRLDDAACWWFISVGAGDWSKTPLWRWLFIWLTRLHFDCFPPGFIRWGML